MSKVNAHNLEVGGHISQTEGYDLLRIHEINFGKIYLAFYK